MKTILLLLLAVTILGFTSGGNISTNNVEDLRILLHEAVASFSKLLDFMKKPRTVVGDLSFGIVLAAAQLSILEKYVEKSVVAGEIIDPALISELEQKCIYIYSKLLKTKTDNNRSDYDIITSHIVKQELWEMDYPIVHGKLKKPSSEEKSSHLSTLNLEELLMMGTPKELESDECLARLVVPTHCEISEKCKEIMTNKKEVHGYPKTHRLLFYQTAKRLGCGNYSKFGDIQEHIVDLCSDILQENHNIVKMDRPPMLRDLFLEQITLCGMEGFAEFLNPKHIGWVLKQQTPEGCFTEDRENLLTAESETEHPSHRVKREDGNLGDGGCTMHITSMASVYLSLHIRALVVYLSHSFELQ